MKRLVEIDALSECKKIFTGKISCKENNKSVQFECNSEAFYKVKIDDVMNIYLTQNDKKCDYAIVSKDMHDTILFIELKGQRVSHALKQIIDSKDKFSHGFKKVYGAIAYGKRIPAGTTEQKYTLQAKSHGIKRLFLGCGKLILKYQNKEIIR